MLDRRGALLGGAAILAGLGARQTAAQSPAAATWTALPNGCTTTINSVVYEAQCGENAAALQISNGGVYRFSMLPGNLWPSDDPNDSERTELSGWRGQARENKAIWASWSLFYEPGPWSTSDWCVLRQVYARFLFTGGPWSLLLLKPGGVLHWHGAVADDAGGLGRSRYNLPMPQGEWLNFVETYKFDPGGANGYWKAWLNGKQVLEFRGAVGLKGATSHYPKFGIYRGRKQKSGAPVPEIVSVRFANMRFTTRDLSDLIAQPDALPPLSSEAK